MDSNWFNDLFIDEAKPALSRHTGSGSGSEDVAGQTYILVDEAGNECPAVYVDSEVVFTADENDIREGKVAATGTGVVVGTKEIPAYYVMEGYSAVPSGSRFSIPAGKLYDFTKLQAIICPWSGTISGSVAAEKVAIADSVYSVNSVESIAVVTKDGENQTIDLGFANETDKTYVLRYFSYKEEY